MAKIDMLYKNLVGFLNANPGMKFFSEEKPFQSFISVLYEKELDKWTSFELVESFSYSWLEKEPDKSKLMGQFPDYLRKLKAYLKANTQRHFVIVPLFLSSIKADIKAKNFRIISGTEEAKIEKLIKISGTTKTTGQFFSQHTKQSRSPSFFMYPLLVIPIKSQTLIVRIRSVDLAKLYFYIIRTFWMAEKLSVPKKDEGRSGFRFMSATAFDENSHLAIWSKRSADFSHSPLHYNLAFRDELDFIGSRSGQIDKMINVLIFSKERNEWNEKFLNALIILNKGLDLEFEHEESLALLVYLSAAESLLTEGRNEKSLRLASILPKLSKTRIQVAKRSSRILKELYLVRNSFVHAATDRGPRSVDQKADINSLVLLTSLISSLLVNNYDKTNTKSYKDWISLTDSTFEKKVFG